MPDELRRVFGDGTALYAVAGAGDLAVEKLRTVRGRMLELRGRMEPKAVAEDVQARVAALQHEAFELPARATIAAVDLTSRAGDVYDDLAARGKKVVDRIGRQRSTQEFTEQAATTVRATKRAATTARRSAKRTRSAAKGAATSARKAGQAATEAVQQGAEKVGD